MLRLQDALLRLFPDLRPPPARGGVDNPAFGAVRAGRRGADLRISIGNARSAPCCRHARLAFPCPDDQTGIDGYRSERVPGMGRLSEAW